MSRHWSAPAPVLVIDENGSFVLTRNVSAVVQTSTGCQLKGFSGDIIALSTFSAEELHKKLFSLYDDDYE